jgi:hypothetical protein
MSRPLWKDRDRIVSSLAASDTHRAEELAAYIDRALADAARRAQDGPRSARAYSVGVEAGIRRAIGQLPAGSRTLGRWNLTGQVMSWIEMKGPGFFGLRRVPDVRVVRRVLSQMIEERGRKMGIAESQCLGGPAHTPNTGGTPSPTTQT